MERELKKIVLASFVLAIVMMASAVFAGGPSDFGLGIWVNEEGTNQWEAVIMGISWDAPLAHPWSINKNVDSRVHIILDDDLTLEMRRHEDPNWFFNGRIVCDDYSRDYLVRYGFISSSSGGPWDLSPYEPRFTLTQSAFGTSNAFDIARQWGSKDLSMGGNFDFTVDFKNPTSVPEPSSLLGISGGLIGLGGLILRRKK